MVLPVTIALFALLLLYAGVHDMTVTDALRALLGRPPKGKLGSLSPVTPTAPVLSGGVPPERQRQKLSPVLSMLLDK